jgi:hypothetical protein
MVQVPIKVVTKGRMGAAERLERVAEHLEHRIKNGDLQFMDMGRNNHFLSERPIR